MKRLLLLVAAALGATFVKRKLDEQQAERDLWAEATNSDTPPPAGE
ncbi:MAG: DLW-39 family protein [Actinomycetia bacterium]|nr:DLW-39 family protein [Actinomycetes bacterium]